MKIKSLLAGMFACAALVACTNNDLVEDGGNQPLEGDAYVAVNFTMTGAGSSRAADANGFDKADPGEVKVTSAIFFFIDANGNSCADPAPINGVDLDPWSNGTGNIDKESTPVIILKNKTATPASIVAILNPNETITERLSLTQLQAKNQNYNITTDGNFVMSSSVYMDPNGNTVIGAPVSAINIGKDEPTAIANPVIIPVERVVARVSASVKEGVTGTNSNTNITGSDAKEITVEIDKWWLDNTNPTSYLIKKINTGWENTTWWNDITNSRSYWAESASNTLEHGSYNSATATDKWCLENTSTEHTQLVAAGVLKVGGVATTLVKWRGALYTESGFKTAIANLNDVKQYYIKNGDQYKSLTAENLDFAFNTNEGNIEVGNTPIKDWQAVVKVASGTPQIYTISTNADGSKNATEVSQGVVNDSFKNIATVQLWKDGKTYFYTPIEHNSNVDFAKYGIVRNHKYILTINSISGLGTPVPNPDKVIIPEKPIDEDKESYIAAEVQILSYKVISQGVDLN